MWRSPALFQEYLNQKGLVGDLYNAMLSDDLADAVIVALDLLKKTNSIPALERQLKCKIKSSTHRQLGNKAFKSGMYQKAFESYNKALMFAPKGSEELVFAFSNRSALLATCNMYQACLNDIQTCFALGCPSQITLKLSKRREEAMRGVWVERMASNIKYSDFAEEYFIFHERRNPQIHCVSTDVGVVMESQVPKVVATRDVKVGKVIAIEEAYVVRLDSKLVNSACYYCHKLNLNLIPCEGCCSVLFCNINCMRACMDEYHCIECPIMEIFKELTCNPVSKLCIVAAIKLKNQFKTWEEFNEASCSVGLKRMRKSEINDIFDGENKFSLLNFKDDNIFKYGSVYNASFSCAIVIHYLSQVKFFPTGFEKVPAIFAFSRVLMYFTLNLTHTQITSTVSVMADETVKYSEVMNYGIFPFTSKLKGVCNPNVLVLGLNKRIALIAIQPLKPGMELTVGNLGHWMDKCTQHGSRWMNMFSKYGTACTCVICTGDWKLLRHSTKPTETHLRSMRKLNINDAIKNYSAKEIGNIFPKCCKTLAFLSDIPFSDMYMEVYKVFRESLHDIQDQYTSNILLDYVNED